LWFGLSTEGGAEPPWPTAGVAYRVDPDRGDGTGLGVTGLGNDGRVSHAWVNGLVLRIVSNVLRRISGLLRPIGPG